MGLLDLLPSAQQIELLQGVERDLIQRKRRGTLSGVLAIVVAIVQVLNPKKLVELVTDLMNLDVSEALSNPQSIGVLIVGGGLASYLVSRRTSFLMKETEEPFRYTFWVDEFKQVEHTPGERFILENSDRFHLLNHDLMERLNKRIGRLYLLDVASLNLSDPARESLTSHIHISGYYAIRERKDDEWIIQVTPRIRIGPPERAEALGHPVEFVLRDCTSGTNAFVLQAGHYNHIIELLYSRVASEIYKQIKLDLKEKISLFPTHYLRAAALYHEARDFETSNTIDAYQYAIELYKESIRSFEIRLLKNVSTRLLNSPLWRLAAQPHIMESDARIGYSRCKVFHRTVLELAGRYRSPLFGIPGQLEKAIDKLLILHNRINPRWPVTSPACQPAEIGSRESTEENQYHTFMALLTFPKDSPMRRQVRRFEKARASLFEAYTVAALTHSELGLDARAKAEGYLVSAKSVDPLLSQESALWLLVAAEIETDINRQLLLLRQATEKDPNFEIAQYRLAQLSETRMRMRNEIRKENAERLKSVFNEYERVIGINPGNLGAIAAQGYLRWLLQDLKKATESFQQGCDIKDVVTQTFIGHLKYGLARIAAEQGNFNDSYDLYLEAVATDPGIAAFTYRASLQPVNFYYDCITVTMLKRYGDFKETVREKVNAALSPGRIDPVAKPVAGKVLKAVLSFVLNDFGNACLNYFHRYGERRFLKEAIEAYEEAIVLNCENTVVYFNLSNAYDWSRESLEKISQTLARAERLAPAWPVALIASTQTLARKFREANEAKRAEILQKEKEVQLAKEQVQLPEQEKVDIGKPAQGGIGDREVTSGKLLTTPREVTSEDGRRALTEVLKQTEQLEKLREEAKALQERWKNEVFGRIDRIMDQTKFISLFEGLHIDTEGRGVDALCGKNKELERELLDETDIAALKVWADILSENTDKPAALQASTKLCLFIREFVPENFDVSYLLYCIHDRVAAAAEVEEAEKSRELREQAKHEIRYFIKKALDVEPAHYIAWSWAKDFMDEVQDMMSAMEPEVWSEGYHYVLGNLCLESGKYSESAEHFESALRQAGIYQDQEYLRYREGLYYKNRGGSLELLGRQHKDRGDEEEARNCWRKAADDYAQALAIEPGNAEYLAGHARSLCNLGEWSEAVAQYEKAVEAAPDNGSYRRDLVLTIGDEGRFLLSDSQYDMAIEKLTEGINRYPEEDLLYFDLARALMAADRKDEAIEAYLKAIDKGREVAFYRAELTRTLKGLNRADDAEKIHKEALTSATDGYFLNDLGDAYFSDNDYDKAIESYQAAIEKDERQAFFHKKLADAFLAAGKAEQAEQALRGALRCEPENAGYWNDVGNLCHDSKNYGTAAECYRRAITIDPNQPVYHANLGGSLLAARRWKESEQAFSSALKLDTENPVYMNQLGNAYYNGGDYREAEEWYRKAVEKDPNQALYHIGRGGALLALGRGDEAEKAFSAAVELDPDNAVSISQVGNAYYNNREYEKAEGFYRRAVAKDPGQALYHQNLCVILSALGRPEEAEQAIRGALEREPDNAIFLNQAGNLCFGNNDFLKAEEYYRSAVERDGKELVYQLNLGGVLLAQGRPEEAEQVFLAALERDPHNGSILFQIGNTYARNNEKQKAELYLRRAVEEEPNQALYLANLGVACFALAKDQEAEWALKAALELEPENPSYFNDLGNLYFVQRRFEEAEWRYRKAATEAPTVGVYHANLLTTLKRMGRTEEAGEIHEGLLAREGENAEFLYDLGKGYFENNDFDEAEETLRKAAEKSPDQVLYHVKLAAALVALQKWKEAEQEYRRVIELAPGVADHHLSLAEVYTELEKWDEAEQSYKKALEIRQDYPKAMESYQRFTARKLGNLKVSN